MEETYFVNQGARHAIGWILYGWGKAQAANSPYEKAGFLDDIKRDKLEARAKLLNVALWEEIHIEAAGFSSLANQSLYRVITITRRNANGEATVKETILTEYEAQSLIKGSFKPNREILESWRKQAQ